MAAARSGALAQRIGEVNTSFTAYQEALYWQDDIRTTRTLTISVGVPSTPLASMNCLARLSLASTVKLLIASMNCLGSAPYLA